MKKILLSALVAFSVWQSLAFADDTDIYLRQRSPGTAPYLMLTFDYRTNMSETFCNNCAQTLADSPELLEALESIVGVGGSANTIHAVMAVFKVVFAKFDGIYVGLMMSNKNDGGTILRGYEEFQQGDANGAKQELIDILHQIPLDGNGNNFYHNVSPNETHYELWRYLNGKGVALGTSTSHNFQGTHIPDYDSSIITGNTYISPFSDPDVDYSCTRLYEVYATAAKSSDNDGNLDAQISADLSPSATGSYNNMVSYLATNDLVEDVDGDQTLKTWIIQMGNGNEKLARGWAARAGSGDQFMMVNKNIDLADVQATLEAAFIEALSESSTFVSASVPVNVFNRIQTLDNFFIALFEANETRRWPGNLKKLKLKDTPKDPDGDGILATDGKYDDIVDANQMSAFSDTDGRIHYEALTFWTDPNALPPADTERNEVHMRDGRAVERGGAGQKVPGFISGGVGVANGTGTRQIFVEPEVAPTGGVAVDFRAFNANDETAGLLQSALGATDANEAKALIAWARGVDVDDEDEDGSTTDNRKWVLGDAIHSRPLALNYGATSGYSQSNPNIRLFMGTNDGFFHIFENTTPAGVESGKELFAFIPRESLPILKKLRDNSAGERHPYGVDGEPVALVVDNNLNGTIENGDEVYVYFGMRRGGKGYYALDVSKPNAEPKLAWKITDTTPGFEELGYTFSTPRVGKVQYDGSPVDVLIFAGGYDMNKDRPKVADLASPTDNMGNAIYVVNARTGALIWKAVGGIGLDSNTVNYHAGLLHSIPSSLATLDSNSNGIIDRAYVGDTGGTIWRIDLPEGNDGSHRADNWTITAFADVGGLTEADDRRFFHPPDIVQTRDSSPYDGVLIASGDRANPLETDDQNYLYLIKDRNITSGNPASTAILGSDITDTTACVSGSETSESGTSCNALDFGKGWKIELQENGEKGLASPITIDGDVYFTTYRPEAMSSSCEPVEGMGALFLVNLKDGSAVNDHRAEEIGPGIPPQVTALGDSALIIPGSGVLVDDETLERSKLVEAGGKSMYIIYWRQPGLDKL